MRFLIDECLSPALATLAHDRGFEAYHVAHRGWSAVKDPQLAKRLVRDNLILVTNNREDFLALVQNIELHPGLVVIKTNVRREEQLRLFAAALDVMERMPSTLNKVVEIDGDELVTVYEMP